MALEYQSVELSVHSDQERGRRWIFAGIAVVEWLALIVQLVLFVLVYPLTPVGVLQGVLLFGSFFTIISNLLVAVAATRIALQPNAAAHGKLPGAVAVYITIVAVIWFILLRGTYPLGGIGAVVDALMHEIIPPVYVIVWIAFLPHGLLRVRDAATWLILPLCYAAWMFGRGAVDGWYPYPFLNVASIGYPRAMVVTVEFVALFFVVGLIFVGLDRWLATSAQTTSNPPAE